LARATRDDTTRTGRRQRRGLGLRRTAGLVALLPLASRAPLYARLLWSLVTDQRTPASRKAILAAALGYVVVGRDLVPDEIPLLGGLDDLVVVAMALDLFLDGVDDDLLEERLEELGLDRAAFDEDVARIRRILPGPLRRTVRRIPGAIHAIAEALQESGFGPRLLVRRIQGT
jgi:uncharacterized membrane protein YkvA (DUF1232 family)